MRHKIFVSQLKVIQYKLYKVDCSKFSIIILNIALYNF